MKFLKKDSFRQERIGPVGQKILLLLMGGISLGLSGNPTTYFRILKNISKEWDAINRRSLYEAIRQLYSSKLVDYKDNSDGTSTAVLTENGKKIALTYDLKKYSFQNLKNGMVFGGWSYLIFLNQEKEEGMPYH